MTTKATPLVRWVAGKSSVFVEHNGQRIPVANLVEAIQKCKEINGK